MVPPPPTKPPASALPPQRKTIAPPAPAAKTPLSTKTFSVSDWTNHGEGTKIVLYGGSGMGKTTLASMAPNAIFIGLDDGGRMIRNPKTGAAIRAVQGVDTFADLRGVLQQSAPLFPTGSTLVLDTITKAEALGEEYTYHTVKTEGGKSASSIEDYGYGKGYRHLTETMRLLLTDLDPLVRRGVNILLLAQQGQATVANLAGVDYIEDGPKLYLGKKGEGVRAEVCEWADHIFRIGYQNISVTKANAKADTGRVSGTAARAIFTSKELYFVAKNRMPDLPPVIAFESPADDSLWQFVFGGAK